MERADIAAGAAERNYAPTLAALGIADGDRRWDEARAILQQVAANYLVAVAAEVEETPARQIATLKAALQGMKARAKQGIYPSPCFAHPYDGKKSQLEPLPMELEKVIANQKPRDRAALPMPLEMAIAAEIPAIELATPGLSMGAKHVAAIYTAIDRLNGAVSTGRKHNWARDAMLDQLVAVADDLAPAVVASRKRKRLWEFISAFMVDAMGMTRPDIEENRSRANKLLPDLRRLAQRREMLKTEQGQGDAARWREIDAQNEKTDELLRKLRGLPPRRKPQLIRP